MTNRGVVGCTSSWVPLRLNKKFGETLMNLGVVEPPSSSWPHYITFVLKLNKVCSFIGTISSFMCCSLSHIQTRNPLPSDIFYPHALKTNDSMIEELLL